MQLDRVTYNDAMRAALVPSTINGIVGHA
jgi:hypothetical protein